MITLTKHGSDAFNSVGNGFARFLGNENTFIAVKLFVKLFSKHSHILGRLITLSADENDLVFNG